MFLRIGLAWGPIVHADNSAVTIELCTPYERDGELLKIERSLLAPFAEREVQIWQELASQ